MRSILSSVAGLVILVWASAAHANGGGYEFGVTFTGSVAPFQAHGTKNVQILEEKLDVDLRRTDAVVVVRYMMKNVADAPVSVRFGFPVEAVKEGGDWEQEGAEPPSGLEALRQAMQQLKGYTVTANGAPVKAELTLEPFATGQVKPFPGSEALKGIAGWMVSELTFPVGEPIALEIHYAVDHRGEDSWVSDDMHASPRTFRYRLSTGAVWKGAIAKGTITLGADGIPVDEVEIAAPRERFKRDGDRWAWSFENLAPTLADDITVRAVPGYFSKGIYGQSVSDEPDRGYLERGGKYGAGHQRFKAKASSTLPPSKVRIYGAEHLAENGWEGTWAEGVPGDGVGEWVELQPKKPRPLIALDIWPGFQSSKPELFDANGRPSRVEILLNDEHRFVATLGDRLGSQLVPILGYPKPVSKLRITILEVFPGKKYADTCITKVWLYDLLTKKPDMHPAR